MLLQARRSAFRCGANHFDFLLKVVKKLGKVEIKGFCQPEHAVKGRASVQRLDMAKPSSTDSGHLSESLLGNLPFKTRCEDRSANTVNSPSFGISLHDWPFMALRPCLQMAINGHVRLESTSRRKF